MCPGPVSATRVWSFTSKEHLGRKGTAVVQEQVDYMFGLGCHALEVVEQGLIWRDHVWCKILMLCVAGLGVCCGRLLYWANRDVLASIQLKGRSCILLMLVLATGTARGSENYCGLLLQISV